MKETKDVYYRKNLYESSNRMYMNFTFKKKAAVYKSYTKRV